MAEGGGTVPPVVHLVLNVFVLFSYVTIAINNCCQWNIMSNLVKGRKDKIKGQVSFSRGYSQIMVVVGQWLDK